MVTLQDLIHHLEVGAGMNSFNRLMRWIVCTLGVLLVITFYDLRAYRNFSTQEAMDAAQVGRNLAQGRGYSTLFIRPLSIYLLQHHARLQNASASPTSSLTDPARLKADHPDLANPPVYPLVLAGLMKALPFKYGLSWHVAKQFTRYQPEVIIAVFNQLLLVLLVICSFLLAKKLFDAQVAWVTAALLLGTELLWRFSVSGLSTLLLMLLFMGLAWCLVWLEQEGRQPKWPRAGILLLSALAGILVGIGGLTRYSFCWLILPVLGFVLLNSGKKRILAAVCALLSFLAVVSPWVARNYSLSGMPFGTATFSIIENSFVSPEDHLQRSLNPEILRPRNNPFPFLAMASRVFWTKLVANSRTIVQSDLPRLGGTWITGFFLVGLMVRFRSPALGRLRLFLLATLLLLTVIQALGRTKLWDDSPDINSENLLVLVAPLIVMYGVALFFTVLDTVELPLFQLRSALIVLFATVGSLPLILAILPPKISSLAYPPYYPPSIQDSVSWTKEDELVMSDIPWAVAWYAGSQCVSLSLDAHFDFFAINDLFKPISALYLTPQTVDRWTQVGDWGNIFLQTVRALPKDESKYPLRLGLTLPRDNGPPIPFTLDYLQAGWPNRLLFTFRPHWPSSP